MEGLLKQQVRVKSVPEYLALIDDETLNAMHEHIRSNWRVEQIADPESIEDLKHNVVATELGMLFQSSLQVVKDEIRARAMTTRHWTQWQADHDSMYARFNALGLRGAETLKKMQHERAEYAQAPDDAPAHDRIRREEYRMITDALAAGETVRRRSVIADLGVSEEQLQRIQQDPKPLS